MYKARILTTILILFSFGSTLFSQTFTNNTVTNITDNNTFCVNINVGGIGIIDPTFGLTQVCIDIDHTWTADLDISLIAPDGTTIDLTSDNGGTNDFDNTCFNDNGPDGPVTGGTGSFNGTYVPEQLLGTMNNSQNANGTWQLCITDDAGGDIGTYFSSSLTFSPPPPPPTPTVQDCEGAIPVCQNVYSETNAYSGTGNYPNEINDLSSCLGSGEKNDVWYIFTVQNSGNLCFDITPNNLSDDYDWAVYDITNNPCSDIYTDPTLEVACNFSGTSGITGANGSGGGQNEPCIPVLAGETYVLNVSQFSTSTNGYTLDFGSSTAQIFDNVAPAIQSVVQPIACGATTLDFDFTEFVECNTINDADFVLTGPGGPYTVSNVVGANCISGGTQENNFTADISPALTTSGAYQLCLVNGSGSVTDLCGNVAPAACLDFNITNSIIADAGNDVSVCAGGTAATIGGSPTGSGSPGLTYSWSPTTGLTNPNIANPSASPATTTTYTVTVTDAAGCQATDDVEVTVTPGPTVSINPGNTTVCFGDDINLTASGMTSYTWSPATGLNVTAGATVNANPTTTQTYTVTGSEPGCPDDNESVTITVGPQIIPSFNATGNFCAGTNSVNFTNTGTAGTHNWTFTSGTPGTGTGDPVNGITFPSNGSYNVTLTTTISGCSESVTQQVTINPDPTVIVSGTNISCNGANDGTALAVPSGTSGYSYFWDNGAGTNANPTGLGPNTYTVTVTDINSCQVTGSYSVTEPPVIASSITGTNATCNGADDGTATVTASGGTPTLTYNWNPAPGGGQGTNAATGLVAGTLYICTITDGNNCTATETFTPTEPTALTTTISGTDIDCNGNANGTATVIPAGGTTGYTYNWAPAPGGGQGTATATGLDAQQYTCTITDANNCAVTASYTPTEPVALTGNIIAQNNVDCNGNSTGDITVSGVGGTTAYQYDMGGGSQTSGAFTGLAANNYSITITDVNNCTATIPFTITEPTVLTANGVGTNILCNGDANGSIDVTVTGGTTNYNFVWSGPSGYNASTEDINSLNGGTYDLTIADANNCTETVQVIIAEPTALTTTISGTDIDCNGNANGTATVLPTGGTGAYTYSWSPVPGGGQGTATATGLDAQQYTCTITDANNCTVTASFTPTQPVALTGSITTQNNVDCNGNTTGGVTVSAAGGTTAYQYDIGAGNQASGAFTGLGANNYTVTITDANNCTATVPVTITEPNSLTANGFGTNILCNGDANGSVDLTVTGGTTNYSFLWSGPAGFNSTTEDINSLNGGTYDVTVTDANSCTTTEQVIITEPTVLTTAITGTDIDCNGNANGTADVTPAGGTTAYSYSWAPAPGTGQNTASVTGLDALTYTCTITDANGCTVTADHTPVQPLALSGTIVSQTNVTCNGASTGEVTVSGIDGTTGYQYDIGSGNQASGTFTGLAAGAYTITITDGNNCTFDVNVSITEPTALTATIAPVAVQCNGNCDGIATVTPGGGSGSYTYAWDNATFDNTAITSANLCAQTYNVTVADAADAGCTVAANVTVTEPTAITATSTFTSATCGNPDGDATVVPAGGAGGFTFTWSPAPGGGQGTATATGIAAGAYTCTITDANGCTLDEIVNVQDAGAPTATEVAGSHVDNLCNGDANGEGEVSVTGGLPGYTYAWSAPSTSTAATATGLTAGAYNVTVTDQNGCSDVVTITITEPAVLNINATLVSDVTCNGVNDGELNVNASGGNGALTYEWFSSPSNLTTGITTQSATGLAAGDYYAVVTDANNCNLQSAIITVSEPALLTANGAGTDVDCNGDADGVIDLTITGGTANYTFAWTGPNSFNSGTEDLSGLDGGTYDVTVTDANNCTATTQVIIAEPTVLITTITGTDIDCNGNSNGTATVVPAGGAGGNTFNWVPAPAIGQGTASVTGLDALTYTCTITDANGCTVTADYTPTQPLVLGGTITAQTNVSCNGANDGEITVTGIDGSVAYAYNIGFGPQASGNFTGLAANNYNAVVTDANNCTFNIPFTITEPAVLTVNGVGTNVDCNGDADGVIDLTVTGGTTNYIFAWTGPNGFTAATEDLSGLDGGTYDVTVTDANNCAETTQVIIAEPNALTATISGTDIDCNGNANGTATVVPTGGAGGNTFNWSPAPGFGQGTASVSGLDALTYTCTITDVNGCSVTADYTPIQPLALGGTITAQTDVSCFGGNDGEITVTGIDGTVAYSYDIGNGAQASGNFTGLTAGNYNITVTDANGCTFDIPFTISQPSQLVVNGIGTDPLCNAGTDGSIDLTVSGGVTNYTFAWTGPNAFNSGVEDPSNLEAGTYDVIVTDNNGCTETTQVIISEPTAVTVAATPTDATCNQADGSALANTTGGTGTLNIEWFDDAALTNSLGNANPLANVLAGTYYVQVTDDNNCQADNSVTIANLSGPTVTITLDQDASCAGVCNGQATANVIGGAPTITYLWNNAETTPQATALCAGAISVDVTDGNGCTASATATVGTPTPIAVTIVGTDELCNTSCDGSADATITGGTAPYTTVWQHGPTAEDLTNVLCDGTYTLNVTDDNGCTGSASVTI
ncbi:MAG: proprotein convertase P-domain-containing protein, partial [Alteromonas sp.]|nr:proprotein convertase P-domain-containing protein [Alteromonas sp.]